ncbi:dolichol-phosphate mannosyltransferase [Gregarina niphandrodes]|uniref:Dolichol-phosphate mannosyltransferase subunit 1 n=1 Tax=Gregarina niphandrodes TaxID=110365 RepID=A0A023BA21_GRENI|nr:dolichol-phosphate mannosyltransferase [Gregarina niphandrodes]EZG77192.1 dolichol-phosphate mannosyltransferase [Gregarina niphandrodes]|eukprot:XP_011129528.1 dolichol-phosphate mannosyltransferase [Gregarina niphandrodes]
MIPSPPTYTVLVATYNEAENLPILVDQIVEAFKTAQISRTKQSVNVTRLFSQEPSYEILIVDDNSPDGTAKVFEELDIKVFPEVEMSIVKRSGKLGLGTAYIAGLEKVRGSFVIILDADLSHQPRHIVEMIKKQKEGDYDIVSGTRYSNGGGVIGWPLKRRLISCLSNQLVAALFSPPATDVTGSFRLYRRDVLKRICQEMNSVGYSFQCEAILRATKMQAKIANVPIEFVDRVYGDSCFNFNEAQSFLVNLAKLVWTL